MHYSNLKNERTKNNFEKVLFSTNTSKNIFLILKLKEKSTYQMQVNFVVNLNKIYKLLMLFYIKEIHSIEQ